MNRNKFEIVSYKQRLKKTLNWFNYLIGLIFLISIIIGSWLASIFIAFFLIIRLYISRLNVRYYIYKIKDKTDVIEVFYFDKEINKKLEIEKSRLKIDFIDDGYANHLRFYYESKLQLKQYPTGYWTRERLSKFYENYCKGKIEIPTTTR